ncbi:MAG: hypothetical protein JSU00_29395 [Acidobacteria bacterium]|nr:hypothetical protein [Acidobacteriota bacterium]
MSPKDAPSQPAQPFVEGMEALVDSATPQEAQRDLKLCEVCLQWTADGHNCYRPGVCELQDK